MKIAFYELAEKDQEYIKLQLPDHELSFFKEKFSDEQLPESDVEILSMFTGSPVTPKLIEHLPNLKLVATRTTGFDHVNLDALAAKGIPVCNVPAYGQNTVAELAFALILALSRKLYLGAHRVKEQGLFSFEGLQGFDLQGKILGVIGTGHIGTYTIKIAKGFGMEVVAYDPFPNEKLSTEYGFKYVSLDELLATADITTLHVPYMPETHHLLNRENMVKMKKGSYLINTARGGLVETVGLVEALRSGVLAGAGLDVLEEEGFVIDELNILSHGHPQLEQLQTALADHELMHMDNVIITPHMGAQTIEALRRILETSIENIKNFITGNPSNIVVKK